MTNLSWFLYLSDVAGNIQPAFAMTGVIGSIIYAAWRFATFDEGPGGVPSPHPMMAVASAILIVIACLMPSKQTIHLIAATEAGYAVATSKEGQEVLDLARKAIIAKLTEVAQ